jgi:uncharacterized membrane protein
VAVANRLFTLNAESLWLDELISVTSADPDKTLGKVWEEIKNDVHPPLYLLFLHYWMALFGTSEIAARAPSLIAGIITVIVGLRYFSPIAGARATMIFGILLATSFATIWYSQEARSYALVILFSTILTGASLRIIENGAAGHLETGPLRLFAFSATILSLLHYFGFILYCASTASILILLYRRFDLLWRNALYFGLPAAPILAWVFYHYGQIPHDRLNDFWIAAPSPSDFIAFFKLVFGGKPIVNVWLATIPFITYALVRQSGQTRRIALFALCSTAIGTVLALAISLRHPVITDRNLLIFLPAIHLLTASGLGWLLGRQEANSRLWHMGRGLAILFIAMAVVTAQAKVLKRHKNDWRGAAAHLLSIEECRDATIFTMGGSTRHYDFYTNNRRRDVTIRFVNLTGRNQVTKSDMDETLSDPCPVIFWGIETIMLDREWVQSQILDRIESEVTEVRFTGSILFKVSDSYLKGTAAPNNSRQ